MARILLVDDDAPFRDATARLLAFHGHNVTQANSGADAIRVQRTLRADVVLCDLIMPGLGGVETIAAIRAVTPEVGVIAITGAALFCQPRSIQTVTGADRTLSKPCSIYDLIDAIDSVLHTADSAARPLAVA